MALSKIDVANMLTGIVPNDNSIRRPNAKPIIINGNQSVSQRTTSVTASDGIYCTDRIKHTLSNDGAATITQESLSSGSAFTDGFANAMKIDVTTADGSLSAAQKYHFRYNIEGQDIQNIKKGTANAEKLTLAFWVKATKTGTNIVRIYTADSDRSCSVAYTVSSSDTWEKKILNFPVDTTGTVIADDNTVGMQIDWGVAAGSNYTSGTLATAWASNTSANDFVGQVNNLDSTSNNFHITGIQLEIGEFSSTSIPPFQHEVFTDNLKRCQRYYETTFDYGTAIGSSTSVGMIRSGGNQGGRTSGRMGHSHTYHTLKRAVPTVTFYDNSGNEGSCARIDQGSSTGSDKNMGVATGARTNVQVTSTGDSTADVMVYHFTAEAEL